MQNRLELTSLVTTHCADSDIEKTYPAIQMAVNGGKQTSVKEMCDIVGLSYNQMRKHGFNLIGGTGNSMSVCTEVCNLPNQDELLEIYLNQRK